MSKHWQVRPVQTEQRAALQTFYRRNRYKGRVQHSEEVWCVLQDSAILAAARMSATGQYPVLRGVWVDQQCRRQGVGRFLLQTLAAQGHLRGYYCFAEASLLPFYQWVGFESVPVSQTPSGLQRALQRYNRDAAREQVHLLKMSSAD